MSQFTQVIIRQSDGTIYSQDFWLDHFLYETMYHKDFIEQNPAYIRYYFKKLDQFQNLKKMKAEEKYHYKVSPEEEIIIFIDLQEKSIFSNKNTEWGEIDPYYLKNNYLKFTENFHQYHEIISQKNLSVKHYKLNPQNNIFKLQSDQKIKTIDELIYLLDNELLSIHQQDNAQEFHILKIDFPLFENYKYFSMFNEKEKSDFLHKLTEIGFIHKKR